MNAILALIRHLKPVHFRKIYAEFNVLEVCGPFLVQNHVVGTDLTGQKDLFEICVNLLGKIIVDLLILIVDLMAFTVMQIFYLLSPTQKLLTR